MTIANICLKFTLFVLLVALLLPLLLACNTESQEEPPFELLEDSLEKEPYSLYRIVISTTCSSEIFNAAQELRERLSKQTGVPCEVVYDKEQITQAKDIFEILLGNTNRATSQKAMKDFRENDYLCQIHDDVLILGGRSDEATLTALNRFYKDLLEHATSSAILPNEAGFLFRAEYLISKITIGGFDLAQFDIVYENDASEPMIFLAKTLQTKIAQEGNYFLDLQLESEFFGNSKRIYLALSDEETEGVAHVRFDAQGVTLSAKDLFGLSACAKNFCEQLLASAETSEAFGMPDTLKTINYDRYKITLASILIDQRKEPATELTKINNLVQSHPSDLIFSGNMSELQTTCFYEMIEKHYRMTSASDFLSTETSCRFLKALGDTSTLYQIGNDTDGFLLLSVKSAPTEELLAEIDRKNLPLLIVIDSSAQEEAWENDSFDRVVFASATNASFSIWAEPNFFLITETISQDGYSSFCVERACAFYS